MLATFLDDRVIVKVGDLTREEVDAVVNAANSTLMGGGGVDGAIHRAGGPEILEECRRLRATTHPEGLPTGEVAITTAGRMPARHVIHTVGPIYGRHNGSEPELLAACYRNAIRLAADHDLASIAFPSISTGVYGYPKDETARVVSDALTKALEEHGVRETRLVFHTLGDAEIFLAHQAFDR
jgi:O-acetyl-ADP-ribose deacetylase